MTNVVLGGRRILVGVDGSRAARNAVLWTQSAPWPRVWRPSRRGFRTCLVVNVSQEKGDAVSALVRHAPSAELLVVGCVHAMDRWSIRTGPVAGALLRGAPCPVMLLSAQAPSPHPTTVLAQ